LEDLRNRPDVPDDILEQLKCLREGLDAINRWKNEVPSSLVHVRMKNGTKMTMLLFQDIAKCNAFIQLHIVC